MEKENKLFKIPVKSLQKQCIFKGKNLLDSISDYIDINQQATAVKEKKELCQPPTYSFLQKVKAWKNMLAAKEVMRSTLEKEDIRKSFLEMITDELSTKKKELMNDLTELEKKGLENLRGREMDRLDTLSKMQSYMDTVKIFQKEKEKQQMLIKIGLIMESLLEELAPYEDTLGRLAFVEDGKKSKADNLHSKLNILNGKREVLNSKLKNDVIQCEKMKKKMFKTSFYESENIYFQVNLINKLKTIDTKSMRSVLEMEAKLANLRNRAQFIRSENVWFYWFLDWVLFVIIGKESFVGITPETSPEEKTQTIIQYYKNLKQLVANLPPTPTDDKPT